MPMLSVSQLLPITSTIYSRAPKASPIEYLAEAVEAVDDAARKLFTLALFS